MGENRIESFSELENAIANLTSLSEEITRTCEETQSIYNSQSEAWASANSTNQANKMVDFGQEAKKISKNVLEVSEAISKFKTTTQNIDEQQ